MKHRDIAVIFADIRAWQEEQARARLERRRAKPRRRWCSHCGMYHDERHHRHYRPYP